MIVTTALVCHASTQLYAQSVSRGEQIVESRCFACHSLDANRVGPQLRNVVGRQAGKVAGFEYSMALSNATHIWNTENIKKWLANPEAFVPGQKMNYQVDTEQDRDDVVAYLLSLRKD